MVSRRSCLLFGTLAVGLLGQWGHTYGFVIRYALMGMLFLSWIDSHVSLRTLAHRKLWCLMGIMVGLAIAGFTALAWVDLRLGLVAALLAVTPTALAAPVVTGLVGGQVEFVTASVLLTNSLAAIALPLMMPILWRQGNGPTWEYAFMQTLVVIALPLTLAQVMRRGLPRWAERVKQLQPLTFYLWLCGLYFASAKAGYFIRQDGQGLITLGTMAGVALVLCGINFGLGRWLGRPSLIQESGQALGQKNTMLAIWACLTFLSPDLVLGPMFYIVFQNLYNTFLLAQAPQR